jgi:hypothetical protein
LCFALSACICYLLNNNTLLLLPAIDATVSLVLVVLVDAVQSTGIAPGGIS